MIIHINDGQKLSFQFFLSVKMEVLTLVKNDVSFKNLLGNLQRLLHL